MDKPIAAMILGDEEGEKEEQGLDEHETVAAELILGINERKPQMVVKALKAFYALCDAEPDETMEY